MTNPPSGSAVSGLHPFRASGALGNVFFVASLLFLAGAVLTFFFMGTPAMTFGFVPPGLVLMVLAVQERRVVAAAREAALPAPEASS